MSRRPSLDATLATVLVVSLTACVEAHEDPEYAGVPAWCEPTYGWSRGARTLELEMQRELERVREQPRACGVVTVGPAGPLTMAPKLRCAARMHAIDMADEDFVAHTGSDGAGTEARLMSAEYPAWSFGELLAADAEAVAPSVEDTVQAWLDDPEDCRTLMRAEATELGVGYERGRWVVLVAAPGA